MKKYLVLITATVMILAISYGCAAPASADSGEPESSGEGFGCPPPCDASLEIEVLGQCLVDDEEGTTVGFGVVKVRNTGEEGVSTATILCWIRPGTGTGEVIPQEVVLNLLPEGPWTEVIFKVIPETTRQDGSLEVRCEVTEESCRPDHNIGKGSNTEFKDCPTAVDLSSFTAKWLQQGRNMPWNEVVTATFATLAVGAALVRRNRKR